MDPSKQDDPPLSSPESSSASSTWFNIPPTSYLTVPSTRPEGTSFVLPGPTAFEEDDLDPITRPSQSSPSDTVPQILEPLRISIPTRQSTPVPYPQEIPEQPPNQVYMSVYSASSADSEYSVYSNPPARSYRVPSFQNMSASRKISTVCPSSQIIFVSNNV